MHARSSVADPSLCLAALAALSLLLGCDDDEPDDLDLCLHGRLRWAAVSEGATATTKPPLLCAPRALPADADGRLECEVLVTFPDAQDAEGLDAGVDGLATRCDDVPGLRDSGRRTDAGAPICEVMQIVRKNRNLPRDEHGWYIVPLAERSMIDCPVNSRAALVNFTPAVRAPVGSEFRVDCAFAVTPSGELALSTEESCAATPPVHSLVAASDVGLSCEPGRATAFFDDREALVTVGSPECNSGACLVYGLHGIVEGTCGPENGKARCVNDDEVPMHVYCSCRCSAPEGVVVEEAKLCTCPSGFSCVDDLLDRPDGIAGGYCVNSSML